MKTLGVVILNWNGGRMVIDCIRSLLDVPTNADIIVIDNDSTDGSQEMISQQYPQVRLLKLDKNYGYAEGYNRGIIQILHSYEFLLLLNNDTRLPMGYLGSLMAHLASLPKTTGMVALKMVLADGVSIDSIGLTMHRSGLSFARRKNSEPLWFPSGGGGIYRTKMLSELYSQSGEFFDNDFKFYSEDVDLGFRARLNGWGCDAFGLLSITHLHSVSVNRMPSHFAAYHNQRNQLWVVLKNYPKQYLFRSVFIIILYQFLTIGYYILKGYSTVIFRAKYDAIQKFSTILKKRLPIHKHLHENNFPPVPFSTSSVWKLLRS